MSAIVLDDLLKRIGKQRVFSNLNLEVLDGEFFSVVGLKDSGKTTLTRILMGYLKATKGAARIYDMDCYKESKEIKESVTFVPEEVLLADHFRALSIFKKTLAAHNLKSTEDIDTLSDYFHFEKRKKIGDMTERDRKIFAIINALIVKPRLIILDEPTKYLPEEDRERLFSHLKNLNRTENLTVFMLTDSLVEAKRYSKRIAYLYKGEIKDVEYVSEKLANDKLLRITNYRGNINYFTSIGAYLIKDADEETIFYYDGDLKQLTRVIYEDELENYTLENATLQDKMNAYFNDENKFMRVGPKKEQPTVAADEPSFSTTDSASTSETILIESDIPKADTTQEEERNFTTQTTITPEMAKAKLEHTQTLTSVPQDQPAQSTSNYQPISSIDELTSTENMDNTLLLDSSDEMIQKEEQQ